MSAAGHMPPWCHVREPRPFVVGAQSASPAKRSARTPLTLRVLPAESGVLREVVLPARYWNVSVESLRIGRTELLEGGHLPADAFASGSAFSRVASGAVVHTYAGGIAVTLRRLPRQVLRATPETRAKGDRPALVLRVRRTRGGSHVAEVILPNGASRRERLSFVVVLEPLP